MKGHIKYSYIYLHVFSMSLPGHTDDIQTGVQLASPHLCTPWCFSDRESWIDYILITNFCALIIIYS